MSPHRLRGLPHRHPGGIEPTAGRDLGDDIVTSSADMLVPGQLGPAFPPHPCAKRQRPPRKTGKWSCRSEKQIEYLRQIAKQVSGLGIRRLETLARKLYGKPLASLTSFDAAGLIETLKSVKAEELDLTVVLDGVSP